MRPILCAIAGSLVAAIIMAAAIGFVAWWESPATWVIDFRVLAVVMFLTISIGVGAICWTAADERANER